MLAGCWKHCTVLCPQHVDECQDLDQKLNPEEALKALTEILKDITCNLLFELFFCARWRVRLIATVFDKVSTCRMPSHPLVVG